MPKQSETKSPQKKIWRKQIFPFPKRYQLQIASWLRVELHAHFPVSKLRAHLTCTGLVCAASGSVGSSVQPSCLSVRCCFLGLTHLL